MTVFEIEKSSGELVVIPYWTVKEISEINGKITIKYNKTDITIRSPSGGIAKIMEAFREQRACQLFYNKSDDTHFHKWIPDA